MIPRYSLALICLVALVVNFCAPSVQAAAFPNVRTFSGGYLMGICTLAEFDMYNAQYPGIATGCSFTFRPDSTVDIYDDAGGTEFGTYVRFSGNSRIRVTLTSSVSPYGPVTYELYRIGNSTSKQWWGEVRIAGQIWGVFRVTHP
jgi:uncharacterized membrane protein